MDMDLSPVDCDPDEDVDQSLDSISLGFNRQIDLKCKDDSTSQLLPDPKVHVDDEDHEEEEDDDDDDDDFTFVFIGEDDAPVYDDKLFEDGRIRPAFPLFDQNLLLDGEYELEEIDRLPTMPPVDKIFVESPRRLPSSTPSEPEQNDDTATGAYCAWNGDSATATAELSKKSNSTGFSKLWRLKEKVGRSNSDGRDAFVFLKHSDKSAAGRATTNSSISSSSSSKPANSDGTFVRVNVAGGKARVVKQQGANSKGKKSSSVEAYLRSRGGYTEEERRRSYLPYRPDKMGLFTNVHGGLTKNLHPY